MKIYWVRHGFSENNKSRISSEDPTKNISLLDQGIRDANILADKLKDISIDVIYTSEFPRTKQTAELINKFHGVKLIESNLINERKIGYEGIKFSEIGHLLKQEILGEGGETTEEFIQRVHRFIGDIKDKDYKNIIIVTHMAVLQVVKGMINNLDINKMRKQKIGHTEIIEQKIK